MNNQDLDPVTIQRLQECASAKTREEMTKRLVALLTQLALDRGDAATVDVLAAQTAAHALLAAQASKLPGWPQGSVEGLLQGALRLLTHRAPADPSNAQARRDVLVAVHLQLECYAHHYTAEGGYGPVELLRAIELEARSYLPPRLQRDVWSDEEIQRASDVIAVWKRRGYWPALNALLELWGLQTLDRAGSKQNHPLAEEWNKRWKGDFLERTGKVRRQSG